MLPEPIVHHALRAEISRAALRHNLGRIRARAAGAEVLAIVKADAYGHGVATVVPVLRSEGVERFAVATLAEALHLRQTFARKPVPLLVLAAPRPEQFGHYAAYGLGAVVSSEDAAADLVAPGQRPAELHVKVDTGMHRLGVPPAAVPSVLSTLRDADLTVDGLWTHFATADAADASFVAEQTERFQAVLDALGAGVPPLVHVLNGPAAVRGLGGLRVPSGARPLVCAGGALYGLASDPALAGPMADFQPAMRLVADVVHVQTVGAGETVSYGRTWRAERPTRIATLAVGYADGVPRALSNRGSVGIAGRLWPVAGRVCMDMLMVDLGDPDGPGGTVAPGDSAVVWGPGGPSVADAADAAGTMAYELTAGLAGRVARVQVERFSEPT